MKKLKDIYSQKGAAAKLNISFPNFRMRLLRGKTEGFEIVKTEDGVKLFKIK